MLFCKTMLLRKLGLRTCIFDAYSQVLYPISSFDACFYSDAHISIDGFHVTWLHFRRAIVRVCVYHSWCEIQASKCYVESLPLVLKNKRSCFLQGERLAVQLPLDCALALRKYRTFNWHFETIYTLGWSYQTNVMQLH